MTTHAVIGIYTDATEVNWKGRYHHWNGHPESLGAWLYKAYHTQFKVVDPETGTTSGLEDMVARIMAERVGWSDITGYNLRLPSTWRDRKTDDTPEDRLKYGPLSYSARGETGHLLGGELIFRFSFDDQGTSWAYIFRPHVFMMDIYRNAGYGVTERWKPVAQVNLHAPEPDWKAIK